jgi:hypothetical protein
LQHELIGAFIMKNLVTAFPLASLSIRSRLVGTMVVLTATVLGGSQVWAGQAPPPIGGVTGTIALEGTVDQEYTGANTVIVKSLDGVQHVFHFTKDLLVHGGKSSGVQALQGLKEGATVAVHYTGSGVDASAQEIDLIDDNGMHVSEGTVINIDRSRKHIAVMFEHGLTETFELTERATIDAGHDLDRAKGAKVTVFYTDESGRKVAHFFKKTS